MHSFTSQHLPSSSVAGGKSDLSSPKKCSQNSNGNSSGPLAKTRQEYLAEASLCLSHFTRWPPEVQVQFVGQLLGAMTFHQHGQVEEVLKPMLMRDFITDLSAQGLPHFAERILLHLDAASLRNAEKVSPSWALTVDRGYLWKRLLEQRCCQNSLWLKIIQRMDFTSYFRFYKSPMFPSCSRYNDRLLCNMNLSCDDGIAPIAAMTISPGPYAHSSSWRHSEHMILRSPNFYRCLYEKSEHCIQSIENNWRGGKCRLRAIQCQSDGSKGVYCIQYDDEKIISGLRDNTIKVWDIQTLECKQVLRGHSGSVLCLQYDKNIIISGSSDSTARVWRLGGNWECLHVIKYHRDAVLHLRFEDGILVTCSKDRDIVVWNMTSPVQITRRAILQGHRAAVNVVDFDKKYIVSASGDRSIRVWNTQTHALVRVLSGHKRGIACLQYRDQIIVSGSSDNSIRIWDVETGTLRRTLEGHKDLVRCIRFDCRRIVSGSYDGEIKVWDMEAALDKNNTTQDCCLQTLSKHTGRVFRLQFDDIKIVSSSHDDSIVIWDFGPSSEELKCLAATIEADFQSDFQLHDECASVTSDLSAHDYWPHNSSEHLSYGIHQLASPRESPQTSSETQEFSSEHSSHRKPFETDVKFSFQATPLSPPPPPPAATSGVGGAFNVDVDATSCNSPSKPISTSRNVTEPKIKSH